ncbi:MAG: EamA/RhaT family transporter, partial [Rubrivivax sp.]
MTPSPDPRPAALAASDTSAPSWALAAGLVIVCIWGANFAVQKTLFQVLPPTGFLFARYLLMPLCAALLLVFSAGGLRAV